MEQAYRMAFVGVQAGHRAFGGSRVASKMPGFISDASTAWNVWGNPALP